MVIYKVAGLRMSTSRLPEHGILVEVLRVMVMSSQRLQRGSKIASGDRLAMVIYEVGS